MARKRKRKKRIKSQNDSSTILEKKHKLLETSQKGKLLIKFFILIPPLFYGYLKLHSIDITPFTNDYMSSTILRISFIIYYLSWVYGSLFDMIIYDLSLISSKEEKGITIKDYAVALIIIIVFSLLLYSNNNLYIAITLSLFWIVDWLAHHYLLKYQINPLLRESEIEYKKMNNLWNFLRLESTKNYIAGRWKITRYYVGIPILVILLTFSFENIFSTNLNNYFHILSNDFIFSLIFFIFVLSMESWIWFIRLNTKLTMNIISKNEDNYLLVNK